MFQVSACAELHGEQCYLWFQQIPISYKAWTTDTRWLNPKFQIQSEIDIWYLGKMAQFI